MNYKAKFERWLKNARDEETLRRLKDMQHDDTAMKNNFYKDLGFGTAGLRGIMAAGTNCMNIYTVAKASMGMAIWLKKQNGKSIVISYDSRNNSHKFAQIAAAVFANNGIQVSLTQALMPTPFLSFCVRHLKCSAGVMVTASHNPKEYNGYKAYGSDGCQLNDEDSLAILACCEDVDEFNVKCDNFEELRVLGKISFVPQSAEDEFIKLTMAQSVSPANQAEVVYTPLNGAGCRLVPQLLKECKVKKLELVSEQAYPDGNFETCPYPNPEKKEALKLGIEKLKQTRSDILIATDPDADRTAVAVMHKGEAVIIGGNQLGMLLADFLLEARKANGTLPKCPVVIKSIVTTSIVDKIVEKFGGVVFDVLTGFKHIGKKMNALAEENRIGDLVLAFEESCGYLVGQHIRDKDAVATSILTAQMCSYYKKLNKTLVDRMEEIYDEFGKYHDLTVSREFKGASGSAVMTEVMKKLRATPLTEIGGKRVLQIIDLDKQPNDLLLPRSNVIIYNLADDNRVVVRPSGTEPLIKMYFTTKGSTAESEKVFSLMTGVFDRMIGG